LAQVNTAVNDMDKVTQQNAAMVEEATAAASQLQARSEDLAKAVAKFELGARDAGRMVAPASSSHRPVRNPVHESHAKLRATVNGPDQWQEF
jgi:methyl-accepting chemotaxis protein